MKKVLAIIFTTLMFASMSHAASKSFYEAQNLELDGNLYGSSSGDC